jgi:hypothetical protein
LSVRKRGIIHRCCKMSHGCHRVDVVLGAE